MPGDALCKLMANAAVASVLKKVAGLRVARLNERVVNWTPTCYLEDTQFKIDVPWWVSRPKAKRQKDYYTAEGLCIASVSVKTA